MKQARLALSAVALAAAVALAPHTAAAQVTADEGAAFVGAWELPLSAQGQSFTIDIDVWVEDGMLAAEVSSFEGGDATEVDEIDLHDDGSLSLEYESSAQGQFFPVELTLTPNGAEMDAELDIADGMFAMDGTATHRE